MELLRPTGLGVHNALIKKERASELVRFCFRWLFPFQYGVEDSFNLRFRIVAGVESAESVIGQTAAHGLEVVVSFLQGFTQFGVTAYFHVGGF